MSVGNERSPTTSTAIITTANNAHFQYGLRAPNITLEAVSGLAGFEVLDTVLALSFWDIVLLLALELSAIFISWSAVVFSFSDALPSLCFFCCNYILLISFQILIGFHIPGHFHIPGQWKLSSRNVAAPKRKHRRDIST